MKWIRMISCLALLLALMPIMAASADENDKVDAEKLARIDEYVRQQFRSNDIPGGAYAVVENGMIVRLEGIGYADVKRQRYAASDTVYSTASVTKVFTAIAVLDLVEKGKIDLDAPVQSYLPWFQYKDEEQSAKVTVRNLLTHSAGVNRFAADGAIYHDIGTNRNSREDAAKSLSTVPMNSAPGEKGQYCNTCYNLLGLIIEEAAGVDYETYMRNQWFEPVGMAKSAFHPNELTEADIAKEYGYFFGFLVEMPPYWKTFGSSQASEGGLYSSAADLARFMSAVMGHSSVPFLQSGALEQYHLMGVKATDLSNTTYTASGFEQQEHGGTMVLAKSGDGMGSSSKFVIVPALNAGFVLLVGQTDGEAVGLISEGILNIMLGQLPGTVQGTANPFQILGFIALGILLISLVMVVWLIFSMAKHRRNRFQLKRLWTVTVRMFLYGMLSVPVWYLLLFFRPTEAGFFGYPYDLAIALISIAIALSSWCFASAVTLILHKRKGYPIVCE